MPVDDQLVEVGGLLPRESMETEVVEDEQVWGEEGAESVVHRVVHPSLVHSAEEIVGVDEAHGVTGLMAE